MVLFQTMTIFILLGVKFFMSTRLCFNQVITSCQVFSCIPDYASTKLSLLIAPCTFLGYNSLHKGFLCLDTPTSRIYITRHAQFDKLHFSFSRNDFVSFLAELAFSMYDDSFEMPTALSSLSLMEPICLLVLQPHGLVAYVCLLLLCCRRIRLLLLRHSLSHRRSYSFFLGLSPLTQILWSHELKPVFRCIVILLIFHFCHHPLLSQVCC